MIVSYKIEDIEKISYETSKLSDFATGFNLVIVDRGEIEHSGEIEIVMSGDKDEVSTLGSNKGIVISKGKSITRTRRGVSTTIVDPLMDLMKKGLMVQGKSLSFLGQQITKATGDNDDYMVFLTRLEVELANQALRTGNLSKYIDVMFGLSGGVGNGVIIKTDKASQSPVIASLNTIKAYVSSDNGGSHSFFCTDSTIKMTDGMLTVESVFRDTLAPLGLELYWERDNIYSLEPPRLSNPNSKAHAIKIELEQIISMDISVDPYSVPNIIIPDTVMSSVMGNSALTLVKQEAIRQGVLSQVKKDRTFKIQVYSVPEFLSNPIDQARLGAASGKDGRGKLPTLITPEAMENYATFFGSHARRSQDFGRTKGSVELLFTPTIVEPHRWYRIDGEEYFVSAIRHTIARGTASTHLTIIGKREEGEEEEVPVAPSSPDMVELEEKITTLVEKTEHISRVEEYERVEGVIINRKESFNSKSSLNVTVRYGRNADKKTIEKLFGSDVEIKELISKTDSVHNIERAKYDW